MGAFEEEYLTGLKARAGIPEEAAITPDVLFRLVHAAYNEGLSAGNAFGTYAGEISAMRFPRGEGS